MNGNFGRSYTCGTAPNLNHPNNSHPGNGFVLTGRVNCFGRGMGPCSNRMFHTGRPHNTRYRQQPPPAVPMQASATAVPMPAPSTAVPMPDAKGFVPAPQQCYQTNPQGFINGIKNIVNGFINPKLNCDFYSDHHRYYNPKYRNNYMMDRNAAKTSSMQSSSRPDNAASKSNARVKTVFCNFRNPFKPSENPANRPVKTARIPSPITKAAESPSDAAACTIFTNEDFPALPTIKRTPAPNVFQFKSPVPQSSGNKSRRRRCHRTKPPPRMPDEQQTNNMPEQEHNEVTCDDFVVLLKPKTTCNPIGKKTAAAATANLCTVPEFPRRSPRLRQISECSDDSFVICFSDDAREGVLEVTRDSDEEEEDEDDDGASVSDSEMISSDDDDDDMDETDNHVNGSQTSQLDSGFDDRKDKRVRFNLNPEVHMMYKWDYAYRAARKGPWEDHARDRHRFKKRIDHVSNFLSPILDTQHRKKMYKERFDNDNNKKDHQIPIEKPNKIIPDGPNEIPKGQGFDM